MLTYQCEHCETELAVRSHRKRRETSPRKHFLFSTSPARGNHRPPRLPANAKNTLQPVPELAGPRELAGRRHGTRDEALGTARAGGGEAGLEDLREPRKGVLVASQQPVWAAETDASAGSTTPSQGCLTHAETAEPRAGVAPARAPIEHRTRMPDTSTHCLCVPVQRVGSRRARGAKGRSLVCEDVGRQHAALHLPLAWWRRAARLSGEQTGAGCHPAGEGTAGQQHSSACASAGASKRATSSLTQNARAARKPHHPPMHRSDASLACARWRATMGHWCWS
jgi:hypothetical protein